MRDRETCEVHGLLIDAAAPTQVLLNLNPSNMASVSFTRLASLADAYAQYRVRSLRFRLHANNSAATVAAGYVGGIQDTTPSTAVQVMELLPSCYTGGAQQVPSNWVTVPPSDLAGPHPWYKSVLGTADATEEAPGLIVMVRSAANIPVQLEVFAVYEFKAALAPANTPAMVKLMAEARLARQVTRLAAERAALQRVLLGGPTAPPGPTAGGPAS